MMRFAPDATQALFCRLLVSGFRRAGSRRLCFHTVNIHEKPPKVNANHQFVILFVGSVKNCSTKNLQTVQNSMFETGFLCFFSSLLQISNKKYRNSYKMGSGFLPPVSRLTACFFAFSARNARFLKRALPAAQCAVPIPLPVLWWYRN